MKLYKLEYKDGHPPYCINKLFFATKSEALQYAKIEDDGCGNKGHEKIRVIEYDKKQLLKYLNQ